MLTQENKSATNYITKFDEYLNQCGAVEFESLEQTLSRFRSCLRDDYRWELIARGIRTLKHAYQPVTYPDESRWSYLHRTHFRNSSKTTTTSKSSYSRSFPGASEPASSSLSVKSADPFITKPTTFEKKTVTELVKAKSHAQYYRCQEYGHFANQYWSQTKTLLVEVLIEDTEEEDSLEVVVHRQDDYSDASVEDCEFNGCIRTLTVTDLTLSYDRAHLGVVRCSLAQPEQVNKWRRTVIFQTCMKIENYSYKIIVNSGSCINVVASKLITALEMNPVKHPNSYKVVWIDATSIDVQERSYSHSVCYVCR